MDTNLHILFDVTCGGAVAALLFEILSTTVSKIYEVNACISDKNPIELFFLTSGKTYKKKQRLQR